MRTRQLPLFVGLIMLSLMLVGVVSASYPMFHCDAQRTGYVTQDGPQTNATLWVAETAEYADGSPAVHNGKVFVPTWPDMDFVDNDPMGLVCYDAATGTELWTNELGGTSIGSVSGVAVADGQVYLGGTDGRLYCIDEEAGETLWTSGQIDATGYFGLSSSPLVYEGTVYALSASDGVLHAFTPEGIEPWSFSTGGAVGYFTSPAAAGGKIFVAGNGSENNLFCIDAATHIAAWSTALPAAVKSTPVIGDGKVYVTTAERLYALDASTGAEVWNASLGGTSSTPAVAGEIVIAGSSDGLHAYDAGTGILLWDFPGAQVGVSPVVAGNLVYAATNERTGTVYAVDTRTGEEVWSYTLEAPGDGTFAAFYASSPAVSDGVLYIGAENNRLYAFGDGGLPEPAFTGWSGTVMLTAGRTFTVTPFNNESATYTIDRTSALGALDAAAAKGGFDYTVQETTFGPFLYSIGGIAYDEATWDSWLYAVNGVPADVGAADYRLADGDVVTYWYGAWGSNPETAHAVVTITVAIPAPESGGGGDGGGDSSPSWITVTLEPGTFTLTADNSKKTYDVNRQTALGALDAAGIGYTVDDSYYQQYESLFIDSIRGRKNEGTKGWMYQVNGESPGSGANTHTVGDGDKIVFFWSESMSSTPATSPDVISIKVAIQVSPGSLDPDSSDGEGSGATPSSTGEQPNNGETGSLSFSLGLPVGVTVDLGEWGQTFSVNTTGTTAAGETVVVSGNTLTINQSGLVLTVAAKNIDEKEGVARGLIESVTAAINPIAREIEGLGTITASLILNLTGIPAADGRLDVAFNATPDAAAGNAFALAAAENGKEITALAYTMTVTRTNLENGEDIAGAVIRMTISPGWVEEHGGADAIRIARSAEDGTYQVLETRVVGTDESGNLIVEAASPGGLSTFGLLAVRAAQDTHATAATSAAPGASSAAGTPAEASPLIISAIGAIPVIGTAYLIARRRREQ